MNDYTRIERAIHYIQEHATEQPALADIAQHVHLSPHHFQRLFTKWAGVSPKKFLQYMSITHAKRLLESQRSLLDTSLELGLSGTSRLHDLFITIEGMTPGEYKNGGASLCIEYSTANTCFGPILIASTERGICHLRFITERQSANDELRAAFPQAQFSEHCNALHKAALSRFTPASSTTDTIPLHLKGTAFQLQVWQALLQIPEGTLQSYAGLAQLIGKPTASRAVGSAIAQNPVAVLIPCHRVIRASGVLGEYRWGSAKKAAIVGWESAQQSS